MRYKMRQRMWTLRDSFKIEDENGDPIFQVVGRLLSIGDKLSFQDMDDNELAFISQRLISLRSAYDIQRDGESFATVVKNITLFRDKFTVDVPGPNDYKVTGNFLDYDYRFEREGRDVASVSKQFFSLSDTYGVDIAEGEDDVIILATAVVIDLVSHDEED